MEHVKVGTTSKAKVGTGEITARTSMGVIIGAGTLLGAWGIACMVAAVSHYGISGIVKGLFIALGS